MKLSPLLSQDRRFYRFDNSNPSGAIGLEFVNKAILLPPGGATVLYPPEGKQGFRDYPEPPTFRFNKKKGRLPRDMELFHGYWLVSERLKTVLEQVDPDGVSFLKCKTVLPSGEDGPEYWLLDVVRVLDALDLEKSTTPHKEFVGYIGYFSPDPGISAVFKKDVVGSAHIFRLPRGKGSNGIAICDDCVREACKAENIKGVEFQSTAKRSTR